MGRIFAFTDEYGAFGWDLNKDNVSTHFIITAIIVKEEDLPSLRKGMEGIRHKYFQNGEIKSSKVASNHERRKRILSDMSALPFSIFPVVVDKKRCMNMEGLRYKNSFYKFLNNILHKELRHTFPRLTIVADEIGGNEFMTSFIKYVKNHEEFPNLLGETNFSFEASHNDVLIQLADFISGTLAYVYDDKKKSNSQYDYLRFLKNNKKITYVKIYPQEFETYKINNSAIAEDYDESIAELCYRQAILFIKHNELSEDEEIKKQICVLEYLLFRFMNNDTRGYISTKELKNHLEYIGYEDISTRTFRQRIICKLRDNNVIIASSPKGYKIPSKESELYDFVNHGVSIVIPMLERLKKCRDLVKLGTINELDLFAHDELKELRQYFDLKDYDDIKNRDIP